MIVTTRRISRWHPSSCCLPGCIWLACCYCWAANWTPFFAGNAKECATLRLSRPRLLCAPRKFLARDLIVRICFVLRISFAWSRRALCYSSSQWCVFAFGLHSPLAQSPQVSFARKSVTNKEVPLTKLREARRAPHLLRDQKNLQAQGQREQRVNQRRSIERLRRQTRRPPRFQKQN